MLQVKQKLCWFFGFFIACATIVFAQVEPESFCGMPQIGALRANKANLKTLSINSQQSILSTQFGGQWMTTRDTLHVLVVFVQFPDDQYDTTYSLWPKNQPPTYLKTYIDSLPSQQSTNGNLTHYFRQMSLGAFTLTGKTRFVITPHSRQWYQNNDWERWVINKEVLQTLDATLDFAEFDRWKRYGEYDTRRESDGKVDMIFMIYRDVSGLGFYGGEASLGYARTYSPYNEPTEFSVDNGTRTIGNGHPVFGDPGSGTTIIASGNYNAGSGWFGYIPYSAQIHEFAHHWMTDGQFYGHNGDGFWAMLNAWGARFNIAQSVSCPNSFERELMGWIAPDSIYQTTYNVTLTDYITTGDAVKIKVPGSNPNEVFRLEYHLKTSSFDNPEMGDPNAKGLYIIHQTGMNDPFSQLRLLPADGRWTWVADEVMYPAYYPSGLAVYEKTGIDRVNGVDDSRNVPFTWVGPPPTPNVPNPSLIHIFRDRTKDTKPIIDQDPRIFRGDGKDAFTLTKNNIFSPWSNPNSQNIALQKTGIAIEIANENQQTGVIVLNIYYDSTAALSLPPSKPQDVQANFNSSNQAVVTWATNIESDVTSGGGYNIYRELYYGTTVVSSTKLNSSLLTTTGYTDGSNYSLSGIPNGVDLYCRYRVEAVDNTAKVSVKSEGGDIYLGKTTSGNISSTTTWNGKYVLTGNVTILDGATLNIPSGSVVRFASGTTLSLTGQLHATSASFLPLAGSVYGSWGRIILNGGPSYGSYISYSTIQGATEIQLNSTGYVNINYNSITNTINGINGYSSTGYVGYNTFTNQRDHGVIMNNCGIYCYGNTITKSDNSGAALLFTGGSNSNTNFSNDISGYNWGIASSWGAYTSLGYNHAINNRVRNCLYGLYVYQSATLQMSGTTYGNNNISNNYSYNAYVYTNSHVYASHNYWGWPVPTAKFYYDGSSSLDYSDALQNDPWGQQQLIASGNNNSSELQASLSVKSTSTAISPVATSDDPATQARELRLSGKNRDALDLLKSTFKKKNYNNAAILELYALFEEPLKAEVETALSLLPKNEAPLGQYLYGQISSRKGESATALKAFENLAGTSFEKAGKLAQFYVYLYTKNDIKRAEELLKGATAETKEDEFDLSLAKQALEIAVGGKEQQQFPKNSSEQIASAIPTEFALMQNYPNPFNPTTTIAFSLPEANNVHLAVYDYLGREIATLIDRYTSAGKHEVKFDASKLSSGIYFYSIVSGKNVATKKLLLLK